MVVDDPRLASLPIGASLRSDNVEGFVRVLGASFNVTAERRADGVIVLRPAK
jgi:transmembrane sensor